MSQFDYTKDARLQKYTTGGGGTVQAVLTHESVGPDYIAMWLAARRLEHSSDPTASQTFAGMISSLATMYPDYVKRPTASVEHPADQKAPVEPPSLVWTSGHQLRAAQDGWGIFVIGAQSGIEIQRIDVSSCFPGDGEARLHVLDRAMNGSELHQLAISYVRQQRRLYSAGESAE